MPPWNDFPVLLRAEAYFFITFLFPLCNRLNVHNVKNGILERGFPAISGFCLFYLD